MPKAYPCHRLDGGNRGVNRLGSRISEAAKVGEDFEASLLDVSAIAGVSGEKLDALGDKARELAKTFGTEATDNLRPLKPFFQG